LTLNFLGWRPLVCAAIPVVGGERIALPKKGLLEEAWMTRLIALGLRARAFIFAPRDAPEVGKEAEELGSWLADLDLAEN
jgi:hypothetical protein